MNKTIIKPNTGKPAMGRPKAGRRLSFTALMIAMLAGQSLGGQQVSGPEVAMAAAALPPLQALAGAQAAPSTSAAAAFQRVWERTDLPVAQGSVARSWLWGDQPVVAASDREPYAEGQGGSRTVRYYDKSRMEVNDPSADPTTPWYVTNGLLVVEMMSGQVQVGDSAYRQAGPASIPVAGDTNDPGQSAPTYATLARVASLHGENMAGQAAPGSPVTALIDAQGRVRTIGGPEGRSTETLAHAAAYVPQTGHNIPDVFWDFLNRKDTVNVDGQNKVDLLMDWVYVMGYPITEPYWTTIRVSGADRQVLVQAFQRRVLTYSPNNPAGWQVEMGNVGLHYYSWRYGTPAARLGQLVQNGYLLLEGKYVAPPYTLKVSANGDITINGQVVSSIPDDPAPDNSGLSNVPASPQTAADIVHFAEARLRAMGQITEAGWQGLLATIRALPATASVQESGNTILVTDKSGGLYALIPEQGGAQPVEEAIGQQSDMASHWLTTLNSGGVLFCSTQGTLEVAGPNAPSFLSGVDEAFSKPESQRLDSLTALTGADALARVLLAAGPPPAGLGDRLAGTPQVHADRISGSTLQVQPASVMRQVLDNTLHTPKSGTAYLFSVLGTIHDSDDTASVVKAVTDQDYTSVLYDRSTSTIDKFLETSGKAGVLYMFAHGGQTGICPEQWRFESGAKGAVKKYHDQGLSTVYEGETWSTSVAGSGALGQWLGVKQYTVCIQASDIDAHWKDAGTIIHFNSCDTYGLYGAFRSREYVAPDKVCLADSPAKYNAGFWGRLDGTVDGGTKRRVQDAWQATYTGTIFKLNGYGYGRTDLSPAVATRLPGGTVQAGQVVQGQVAFDTDIRTDFENPILMVRLSGPCAPTYGLPDSAKWQGDHTLNFSFKTQKPQVTSTSILTLTIKSSILRSGDNTVPLDGNQIPANTDHVGPNHIDAKGGYSYDDYVWTVQCGPASGPGGGGQSGATATATPRPTPPAVPGTPPPTRVPATPTPPGAGSTPTAAAPTPTPTRPSISYFDGFHLQVIPQSQTSTFYNVYSTNPTHDSELNRYSYNWQLVLPPGDDCSANTFAVSSNPWQALWTHNCQGAPGETIEVTVQREDQQVRFEAPALGPADVTPIPGP